MVPPCARRPIAYVPAYLGVPADDPPAEMLYANPSNLNRIIPAEGR
jgi:hypothetical protein